MPPSPCGPGLRRGRTNERCWIAMFVHGMTQSCHPNTLYLIQSVTYELQNKSKSSALPSAYLRRESNVHRIEEVLVNIFWDGPTLCWCVIQSWREIKLKEVLGAALLGTLRIVRQVLWRHHLWGQELGTGQGQRDFHASGEDVGLVMRVKGAGFGQEEGQVLR